MSNTNEVLVLDLDIKDVQMSVDEILGSIAEVKTAILGLGTAITNTFKIAGKNIQGSMTGIVKPVSDAMGEINQAVNSISGNTEWGFADSISSAADVATIGQSLAEVAETIEKINLPDTILTWINTAGQAMEPLGGLLTNLLANAAAWASTASATIADTAAKAGNTVAQWAQVAAAGAWNTICVVSTAVTTAFGAAMSFLASPIGLVVLAIVALIAIVVLLIANWDTVKAAVLSAWDAIMNALSTAAEWFNNYVIQPVMAFFSNLISSICSLASNAWNTVKNVFLGVADWFNSNVVIPLTGFFKGVWNGFFDAAKKAWEAVKQVFSAVTSFFGSIFSKAWSGVVKVFSAAGEIFKNIKDGILSVFIKIVNGLIDGINTVVAIPFKGFNGILDTLQIIEILGVKPFGWLNWRAPVPQIPHLARGAVLPANRPFLAVVGDQRHGTNIEAPLATIQEAVAAVMGDHISAMMAGFEALLQEQQATRRTIEGIEIGDTIIGQAAQRYNNRLAVMNGR